MTDSMVPQIESGLLHLQKLFSSSLCYLLYPFIENADGASNLQLLGFSSVFWLEGGDGVAICCSEMGTLPSIQPAIVNLCFGAQV